MEPCIKYILWSFGFNFIASFNDDNALCCLFDLIWASARLVHSSTSLGFNLIANLKSLIASSFCPNWISCIAVFPICMAVDSNSCALGSFILGTKPDDLFIRKKFGLRLNKPFIIKPKSIFKSSRFRWI